MQPHKYKILSDLFLIQYDGLFLLYAPLKGTIARINSAAAILLRDVLEEQSRDLSISEIEFLSRLEQIGIINSSNILELTIMEHKKFTPLCVSLYLTDACNLRCTYCYAWGGANPKPVIISTEAAQAGIDFVAQNAVRTGEKGFCVSFHGAGEPTLAWEKLTGFVAYGRQKAKDFGLKPSFTTCTNGVMPQEHAIWLAENTDAAAVSLDGLPEYHDLLRPKPSGNGSFLDTAHTLKIFDEHDMFYNIRATITEANVHTMSQMVEFLTNSFRPAQLQFDPVLTTGRCYTSGCRPAKDEIFAREFMRACNIAMTKGVELGFSTLSFTSLRTFYCCSVSDGFTITHDGYITSCFEACGPERPFSDVFVYGYYDKKEKKLILDYQKLSRLRKRHVHNLSVCSKCFCKYSCAGDCPINGLRLGLPLENGGGRCNLTRSIAKYRLACLVKPSGHHLNLLYDQENVVDDSLASFISNQSGEPPRLMKVKQLEVSESNYMKPPPTDYMFRDLISTGNFAYQKHDFKKALSRYEKAITLNPKSVSAHSNQGLCLHKLGRLKEASEAFKQAINIDAQNAACHLNYGKLLVTTGDLHGALKEFDQALSFEQTMVPALYNKAWVLIELGELNKAIDILESIDTDDNIQAHSTILKHLVLMARPQSDEDILSQQPHKNKIRWIFILNQSLSTGGLESFSPKATSLFLQAIRAFSVEQYQLCLKNLEYVLSKNSYSPLPYFLAAMCWSAKGNTSKANEMMHMCYQLMPKLKLPAQDQITEIKVDGYSIESQEREIGLLPGKHTIEIYQQIHNGKNTINKTISLRENEGLILCQNGAVQRMTEIKPDYDKIGESNHGNQTPQKVDKKAIPT